MESNISELERQLQRLKRIRIYQILTSVCLILTMSFLALWIFTLIQLNAQKKLRGNFDSVKLVLKFTDKIKDPEAKGEGKLLYTQDQSYALYNGPNIDKKYYGETLATYLKQNLAPFFHLTSNDSFIDRIDLPGQELPSNQGWRILSYSERNVDPDFITSAISHLFLDRVNIFVFQLVSGN